MVGHTEDFKLDPVIVPIEDSTVTSPAAVQAWLASLHRDEQVTLSVSVAEIVRETREHGEV